jgi:hypothetical protein
MKLNFVVVIISVACLIFGGFAYIDSTAIKSKDADNLSPNPCESRQESRIAPAAVVGYVNYSSNGMPISGVYIYSNNDEDYEIITYTNETGYYCLNLTQGEWYIQINQTGLSGYIIKLYLTVNEVAKLDVELDVDTTPPIINKFEFSQTESISVKKAAVVELKFTEKNYRVVDLTFARIKEISGGKITLTPMISYINNDDHPPVYSREIPLTPGDNPGEYSSVVEWNGVTSGFKVYWEGSIPKETVPQGVYLPADNRMGNGYSMLMGKYGNDNYASDDIGAIFVKDNQITDFYYMGGGDQGKVNLNDPSSTIQFTSFYVKMNEDLSPGPGQPDWGYTPMTDYIPIKQLILKTCEIAPTGEYIVSVRIADWGDNEDDYRTKKITVDTDPPECDAGGPYIAKQGEEILLDGTGSSDLDSDIVNWTWIVDVPSKSPDRMVVLENTLYGDKQTLKYDTIGNYSISLKVKDTGHNSAVDTTWLNVIDGIAPTAVAESGRTIYEGETIKFDGSDSYDNLEIVKYVWSLYDDEPVELEGKIIEYLFNSVGNYTITLNVSDAEDNWNTYTTWVHVKPLPPTDTTPPDVIALELVPKNGDTEVPINTIIKIPFTEEINVTTLKIELSYENGKKTKVLVAGVMDYDKSNVIAKFKPNGGLNYETKYTLTISVEDLAANLLEGYRSTFTTELAPLPPPKDSDGDDIPDSEDPDNDNDELPNEWELLYDLDPFDSSDKDLDKDEDTLTNYDEYQYGTDPTNPDTDYDGLPDNWETLYDLDPLDPEDVVLDTDNDGKTNLEEYRSGTDPTDPNDSVVSKSHSASNDNTILYTVIGIIVAIVVILSFLIFVKKWRPQFDFLNKNEEKSETSSENEPDMVKKELK